MTDQLLDKLFNPDISEEERDLLCQVSFGEPFIDALGKIRYEDFLYGLKNGKYILLSYRIDCDNYMPTFGISFAVEYIDISMKICLYEIEFKQPYEHGNIWSMASYLDTVHADFKLNEIDERLPAAFKKFEREKGINNHLSSMLLEILNKYNNKDEKTEKQR